MDDKGTMVQQLRIEGDTSNVTIVQQQNVSTGHNYRGKAGKERRRLHIMEKMLWDLLAALPDPKLQNLNKLVVAMAVESFESQKNAGGYLGIAQAKVSTIMRKGADEIKPIVSKNLWKPKAVVPAIAAHPVEMGEILAELPKTGGVHASYNQLTEQERKLMDEGKIIVRGINRNEL